ncbi:hypothetical protein F2Q68_00042777 [Brassica cretica]|uniref:O-fucosyltransferase family protein n=1 Tax=Brassica cretica TaxID=69181 RepID=A0A8S9MEI7_BRACR|nr:hypothetical protein F2Q68_00042777 [Brassica cretica]
MMRKGWNERALLIEVTKRRRSQRLDHYNGHIFIIITPNAMRRLGSHRIHGRMVAKLSIGVIVLLICTLSLLFSANVGRDPEPARSSKVVICGRVWILSSDFVAGDISSSCGNNVVEELWESAESGGWRPSSAPRSDWPPPTEETNGYLRVRCNGGLNQQRSAICNAVLAARIMNATLVLPELDANSFWHDDSGGFQGIYDVEHFIETLKCDVKIVGMIPDVHKKIKAFQAMTQHSAIYLTPFSHRLAEEIDNPEYQRLSFFIDTLVSLPFPRPDQIEILMAFKNEFPILKCDSAEEYYSYQKTEYWTSKDFKSFDGVVFDSETGVVTELDLEGACLSGSLSANSSLFRLHHLRYLLLSDNYFDSFSFLPGLGKLTNLEFLDLSYMGFSR